MEADDYVIKQSVSSATRWLCPLSPGVQRLSIVTRLMQQESLHADLKKLALDIEGVTSRMDL